MKLKEIIELDEFKPNRNFWKYEFKNGEYLRLVPKEQINQDNEVEIVYFWYDHLYRNSIPDIVYNLDSIIRNNEWMKFYEIKEKYGNKLTLPDEASIFINNRIIGTLKLTYTTFQYITHSEYECG